MLVATTQQAREIFEWRCESERIQKERNMAPNEPNNSIQHNIVNDRDYDRRVTTHVTQEMYDAMVKGIAGSGAGTVSAYVRNLIIRDLKQRYLLPESN